MEKIFRNLESKDYSHCEALVNEAWEFDTHFKPQALANIAKQIYTKGAEVNSNYMRVVEVDGSIGGFIFGLNENGPKPRGNFLFGLKIMLELLLVKPILPSSRKELLNSFSVHEGNRAKLVDKGRSEIVLFVVAKKLKGQGLGTQLWADFLSHCQENAVTSIIVETNKDGAATFYEQLGFELVGEFESPVHAFAAPNGQACIYEYRCEQISINGG
jgi:ribosomal protein S18 acetylase RimI-like enzyme